MAGVHSGLSPGIVLEKYPTRRASLEAEGTGLRGRSMGDARVEVDVCKEGRPYRRRCQRLVRAVHVTARLRKLGRPRVARRRTRNSDASRRRASKCDFGATKPGSLVAPLHPSTRATNQPRRPAGASRARDIHLLHVFVAADTTAAASDLMNNPDAPSRAQVRRPLPALTTKRDKTLGWSCQEDARARTRELSGGFARAHAGFNDASTRAGPFGDVSRANPRTPRPSRTP